MYLELVRSIQVYMEIQMHIMVLLNSKVVLHFICICFSGLEVHYHLRKSETRLWIQLLTFNKRWLSIWKVYMLESFSQVHYMKLNRISVYRKWQIHTIRILHKQCLFHLQMDAKKRLVILITVLTVKHLKLGGIDRFRATVDDLVFK